MNGIEIVKHLETLFPKELAYEWDNVGLQIGSLNQRVKTVLVTLDVTKDVLREAIAKKADLVISHHPLIFKPINSVQSETPRGGIITQFIKANIALYTAHTNFDLADGGMNDVLARALQLENPALLDETERIGRYGSIPPLAMPDCIRYVKETLHVQNARFIGDLSRKVTTIGISGGSGSAHTMQAKRKNCDLYITGDVTYHTALDAVQMGQNVLDVGHYIESIFKVAVQEVLNKAFPDLVVLVSETNTDPYQVV